MTKALFDLNKFFGQLDFKHRLLIAGNHEIALNDWEPHEVQAILTNATYLQDSSVVVEGISLYGTPWTSSSRMGFSASRDELKVKFKNIPKGTNLLISHLPPQYIMDLAWRPKQSRTYKKCEVCPQQHTTYSHWGNRHLRERVEKIEPLAHIFGHTHDDHGYEREREGKTLYVNASMDLSHTPVVFHIVTRKGDQGTASSLSLSPSSSQPQSKRGVKRCTIL